MKYVIIEAIVVLAQLALASAYLFASDKAGIIPKDSPNAVPKDAKDH